MIPRFPEFSQFLCFRTSRYRNWMIYMSTLRALAVTAYFGAHVNAVASLSFPEKAVLDYNNCTDFAYELTPFNSTRVQDTAWRAVTSGEPLVSVITTLYNAEEEDATPAMQSVFGQTLSSWEWIVVGDGSEIPAAVRLKCTCSVDASKRPSQVHRKRAFMRHATCRTPTTNWKQEEPPVLCINSSHSGLPGARMQGVANSVGKYLLFLDGDDYLEPTFLEKTVWLLETRPSDVVAAGGWTVGFGGMRYVWKKGFSGNYNAEANALVVTNLVRRDAFLSVGGFNTSFVDGLEDWDLWQRFAQRGLWGVTVPEVLFWYRRTAPNPSKPAKWASWNDQSYRVYFREQYPRYWEMYPFTSPSAEASSPGDGEANAGPSLLPCRHQDDARKFAAVLADTADRDEKLQHDIVATLASQGWHVTLLYTGDDSHDALPNLLRYTSDYFVLTRFLGRAHYAQFIETSLRSRRIDAIFVARSVINREHVLQLKQRLAQGVSFAWFGNGEVAWETEEEAIDP